MTPLATRMFREGTPEMQKTLAQCQFFECTGLWDAAQEMVSAECDLPEAVYSEFSQLPAPHTALEVHTGTARIVFICSQSGQELSFRVFIPWGGAVAERARFGFIIGTYRNLHPEWMALPGEPADPIAHGDHRIDILRAFNFLVEALLRVINQPGLVERRPRDTDKRAIKGTETRTRPPLKWHECRIRSGVHSGYGAGTAGEDHRQHQLHYVRKYFKPSIQKWIDGYWRGNADLGIHLKWYSPRTSLSARKAAADAAPVREEQVRMPAPTGCRRSSPGTAQATLSAQL